MINIHTALLLLFTIAIPVEFIATRRSPGWNPYTPLFLLIPNTLLLFWMLWLTTIIINDYERVTTYTSMAMVVHAIAGLALLVAIPMGAALFWKQRKKCGTILTFRLSVLI
jgi:hypothetical protein